MKRILFAWLILFVLLLLVQSAQSADIYVAPEAEHMSHASQHWPFTKDPTNYGANMLGIVLGADFGKFNIELAESYNFSPHWQFDDGTKTNGEICGPREEFSLRMRYKFTLWSK